MFKKADDFGRETEAVRESENQDMVGDLPGSLVKEENLQKDSEEMFDMVFGGENQEENEDSKVPANEEGNGNQLTVGKISSVNITKLSSVQIRPQTEKKLAMFNFGTKMKQQLLRNSRASSIALSRVGSEARFGAMGDTKKTMLAKISERMVFDHLGLRD